MSDMNSPSLPGKEGLRDDLKQVAQDLGRPPTTREYDDHGRYTYRAFYTYWEDWGAAVTAAGCDPANVPQLGVPKDAFLSDLQRVASEHDTVPTMEEYQEQGSYTMELVYKFFESYREAIESAGLDGDEVGKQVSRPELLTELRAGYEALGYPPTTSDMRAFGEYGPRVYRQRFGSWADALDAAGIPVPDSRRPDDGCE